MIKFKKKHKHMTHRLGLRAKTKKHKHMTHCLPGLLPRIRPLL